MNANRQPKARAAATVSSHPRRNRALRLGARSLGAVVLLVLLLSLAVLVVGATIDNPWIGPR